MYTLDTFDICAFYTLPVDPTTIEEAPEVAGKKTSKKNPYGNQKRTVNDLLLYKAKGAFALKENITNISKMKTIVFSCHNRTNENSQAQALGIVRKFLGAVGPLPLDMTKDEHIMLLKRYDESINVLKKTYQQQVDDGEGEVFEYAPVLEKAWENVTRDSSIYDEEFPSDQKILDLQDSLIAITQLAMPNSRSNMATLVNGFHDDADLKKDNVFLPTGTTGTSVIIWNERKIDRIKSGKPKVGEVQDPIDNTRYIEPLNTVLPLPFMEPERVSEHLTKFVRKYRKNSKYIFIRKDGTPFMNETKDDKRFEPYRARVKIATGQNISVVRRSQITAVRDMSLTKQEHAQYAADCHHSKEENNHYWRDYVFRDAIQRGWRRS
ncbi:hypothetical protein DFJ77DRAFT_515131 [Powellomyces hirtus]|nr:hypothetical protein DFJ77DRAFT_515131 [Powellomyces hirtus]